MTEVVLASALLTAVMLTLTGLVMGARAIFQPARPVEITVNGQTRIRGITGTKLLSVLTSAGVPLPSACAGAGTCGLCRVKVVQGAGEALPTEKASLGPSEIGQGLRLACQLVVRNALSIEVPMDLLAAEQWTCRVVSNKMLAPLIKELVLQLPADAAFSFHAGAFVQITAPPFRLSFSTLDIAAPYASTWDQLGWRGLKVASETSTSRAYSVANRPADTSRGQVVMNIRLAVPPPGAAQGTPPGIVSSYLFGLAEGGQVMVAGPFGEFRVRDSEREMVLVAGGVGMAPLRAIVFDELQRKQSSRKMSFWYGARTLADVFYAEELAGLARQHPNFDWTVALSDPLADEWDGAVGFIHEVLDRNYLSSHPAPEACDFYLCGPPLMIQAVLAMLENFGVSAESIFFDDFGG